MDLTIKILEEEDVGKDYVEWFLDTEVVRFSDTYGVVKGTPTTTSTGRGGTAVVRNNY